VNYKEKINSLTNANRETWLLQKSIEEDNSELSKLRVEKHTILGNFSELKKAKYNVDSALQLAYTNRDLKSQYEEFSNSLKEINEKLDPLRKNMEEIKELENSYRELLDKESSISSDYIPNLTRCIEEAKYQMVLYNQYKKDYAEYSQLYDKLEQVKYATSVNGIQAEIIDIKMNEIVSSINTLAGMMFGGRFELQKFSVTSDTFAIPFLDKETGLVRPDLSMMSNSQLSQFSMIISFVLLHNASQKYNIIRLDEIDNNLDTDNRLNFFELINTIMDILGFEQCVIISHNNELDLSSCDLMITRLQNTEQYYSLINSGANVIADFMKG
jgi:chromosome segregation ATPase